MYAPVDHLPRRLLPAPFAVLTDRVMHVAERAQALARAGREDEAAVDELRALAHGRRRPLVEASQLFKVSGEHLEIRWRNRAVRLLHAATTGRRMQPEDPAVGTRLDSLERLAGLPVDRAFDELAAREPRLRMLRDQVLDAHAHAANDSAFAKWLRRSAAMHRDLVELVGHARPDFDPLCSAVIAYAIASAHLADLAASPA
jgi:hypothetical protein